ncbi:unnamed protein product, partial [Urochloa humidicola]
MPDLAVASAGLARSGTSEPMRGSKHGRRAAHERGAGQQWGRCMRAIHRQGAGGGGMVGAGSCLNADEVEGSGRTQLLTSGEGENGHGSRADTASGSPTVGPAARNEK